MNVCTKCHRTPAQLPRLLTKKTTDVNLIVALNEIRITKVIQIYPLHGFSAWVVDKLTLPSLE